MTRRIAVRAIVVHEGKLLCARLRPNSYSPRSGTFWCVPGGGLDDGEDLLSGLEREMIEELGVKPKIGNLLYIQQYRDEKGEYLEFLFEVTNSADYLDVDLTKTTHGVEEILELSFLEPKSVDNLLPSFLTSVQLENDIALGETKYFNNL